MSDFRRDKTKFHILTFPSWLGIDSVSLTSVHRGSVAHTAVQWLLVRMLSYARSLHSEVGLPATIFKGFKAALYLISSSHHPIPEDYYPSKQVYSSDCEFRTSIAIEVTQNSKTAQFGEIVAVIDRKCDESDVVFKHLCLSEICAGTFSF